MEEQQMGELFWEIHSGNRGEGPGDVKKLNKREFMQALGHAPEADLVDRLRENCGSTLSLVAVQDDRIVGHIIFSWYRSSRTRVALHHRAWTSRI
jgi:predicted N-acetyltransferase YhbS